MTTADPGRRGLTRRDVAGLTAALAFGALGLALMTATTRTPAPVVQARVLVVVLGHGAGPHAHRVV